jgi:hypothetical protein
VYSNKSQAPSVGDSKSYPLYFKPYVKGIDNDSNVTLSFDMISEYYADDTSSWIYLESVEVYELIAVATSEIERYNFDSGSEGWTFIDGIGTLDSAISDVESSHLGMSADGSTNCFSYWVSPDIGIVDGTLYAACFEVSSSVSNPDDDVSFRLRANQMGSWQAWNRTLNSNLQSSPSDTDWKTYFLVVDPDVTDDTDNKINLSWDIISFDPSDDTNSWLYLESVSLLEINVTP